MKYRVVDEWFGCIPTFTKHQVINNRESDSNLPSIDDADEVITSKDAGHDACRTRAVRVPHARAARQPRVKCMHKWKEGRESAAASLAERFDDLWKSWPEDMGDKGNRKRALDQWQRLKPTHGLVSEILHNLDLQVLYKRELRQRGEFAANFQHVERWIRDRGWENDVGAVAPEPMEYIV